MTRDESVAALVAEVIARFGRIDVLVNNAGRGLAGAAEESSVDETKAVFETNLFGTIRMTNAVLPHMRAQGAGRVVNVSSVLGLIPAPYMAVYASTKHAVEGYSESVVILAAATNAKPRLRYPAGPLAGRVSVLRRLVPWRAFDKQIRKTNRLAG